MKSNWLFVALSLLALALPDSGNAQDQKAQDADFLAAYDDSGTFTFVWENDYFANTDRNYTNGLRLAYISGFKQPQGVSRWVANNILGAGDSAGIRRGFALGHSIFTPQDTSATAPLPDQRRNRH